MGGRIRDMKPRLEPSQGLNVPYRVNILFYLAACPQEAKKER